MASILRLSMPWLFSAHESATALSVRLHLCYIFTPSETLRPISAQMTSPKCESAHPMHMQKGIFSALSVKIMWDSNQARVLALLARVCEKLRRGTARGFRAAFRGSTGVALVGEAGHRMRTLLDLQTRAALKVGRNSAQATGLAYTSTRLHNARVFVRILYGIATWELEYN